MPRWVSQVNENDDDHHEKQTNYNLTSIFTLYYLLSQHNQAKPLN